MSVEDILAGVDTATLTIEAKLILEEVQLLEEMLMELRKITQAMVIATEEELTGEKE